MDITIIESCGIHGEIVEKDEIADVDTATANRLIGMGKARPSLPEDFEKLTSGTKSLNADPQIQNQDPAPDNRDPKPAKS